MGGIPRGYLTQMMTFRLFFSIGLKVDRNFVNRYIHCCLIYDVDVGFVLRSLLNRYIHCCLIYILNLNDVDVGFVLRSLPLIMHA